MSAAETRSKKGVYNTRASAYTARMNTDPFDQTAFDSLPEDFDSAPLPEYGRYFGMDYLDSMWSRRGGTHSKDAITAHAMVQNFANAFARDGHYRVTFDANIGTAGTNMDTRDVMITPAPVLDDRIDAQRAGRILIGLVAHEISHPRYDTDTSKAVKAVFSGSLAADHISNVLSDVRIERRFVGDYPGYDGVFEPTLEYVADSMVERNHGKKITPSANDPLNLMTMAVRFASYADWGQLDEERIWWEDWRDRWAHEDSPRRHVSAVREALRHIVIQEQKQRAEENGDGQPEQKPGGGAAQSEAEQKDNEDLRQGSGKTLGEDADAAVNSAGWRSRRNNEEEQPDAPTCTGTSAIDHASGISQAQIDNSRGELQREVTAAEEVEQLDNGESIDVAVSTKGLEELTVQIGRNIAASRPIRDALLRSRTGHTDVTSHQKHGRLDQRALHRIANRDVRLFDRKRSSSPGKYLFWMLLDASTSMNTRMADTVQSVTAIADATQHVPTVRAAAWSWSSSFRGRGMAGVAKLWQSGQPTTQIAAHARLKRGGTPDATVIRWATRAILREVKGDEQPVIIIASDGEGAPDMKDAVAEARAKGIDVRSVALAGDLRLEAQRRIYGDGFYVPWMGSMTATSIPLARMIAKIVSKSSVR